MKKLLLSLFCLLAVSAFGQGTSIRSNNGMGTNTTLYSTTTADTIKFSGNVTIKGRTTDTLFGTDDASGEVWVKSPSTPFYNVLFANTNGNTSLISVSNGNGTINLTGMSGATFILNPVGNAARLTNAVTGLASAAAPFVSVRTGGALDTNYNAGSLTNLQGSNIVGITATTLPTTVAYGRWELQTATSQTTNFVIDVTNNLGRFMSHYIQIVATDRVMIHPLCFTNATATVEVIASGAARMVLWPTNIALLNTTGLTLFDENDADGTNWSVTVPQNQMLIMSVKTNEYFGRRVATWRTNVW